MLSYIPLEPYTATENNPDEHNEGLMIYLLNDTMYINFLLELA